MVQGAGFRLRTGYIPPKTAHVVRGGLLISSDIRKTAESCKERTGVYGISLWIAPVPKLEDLVAQTTPFIQRYSHLAICSLAVLHQFETMATGRAPHYTLVLEDGSDEELAVLRDCFLVIPNPLVGS